jgi:ribonucleoside-diphosphate reductase alpha chain
VPTVLLAAARECWDRALELGEKYGYRNAQVSVHRADRHDRPADGLRHDRHRARLRAGEVQEAGRRRLLQDREPEPCRRPCGTLGYTRPQIRRHRRYVPSAARTPRLGAPRSITRASRQRGFDAASKRRSKALVTAFDIRFAFSPLTRATPSEVRQLGLDAEALYDRRSFDLLKHLGFTQGDIEASQRPSCGR